MNKCVFKIVKQKFDKLNYFIITIFSLQQTNIKRKPNNNYLFENKLSDSIQISLFLKAFYTGMFSYKLAAIDLQSY
jgi:hypothetical protein